MRGAQTRACGGVSTSPQKRSRRRAGARPVTNLSRRVDVVRASPVNEWTCTMPMHHLAAYDQRGEFIGISKAVLRDTLLPDPDAVGTPVLKDDLLMGFNGLETWIEAKRALARIGVAYDLVYRNEGSISGMLYFNAGTQNVASYSQAMGVLQLHDRPDDVVQDDVVTVIEGEVPEEPCLPSP